MPWPWYYWAAIGLGGAALLGGRKAGAAAPPPAPVAPGVPSGPAPVLRQGSTGPFVSALQGLLGVPVTGTFDQATRDAVVAFQTAHGLDADGVVGKQTWGALGVTGAAGGQKGGGVSPGTERHAFLGEGGLSDDIGERESQILAAVQQGATNIEWKPLTLTSGGHTCEIMVTRRCLRIHSPEDVIVMVSGAGHQAICDALNALMLTTRVSDEIWRQAAVRMSPPNKPWNTIGPGPGQDGSGSKTFRMRDQTADIDTRFDALASTSALTGFVANEGKDWIVTRRNFAPPGGTGEEKAEGALGSRHNVANFGWYSKAGASKFPSPGGESVMQNIGLAHDRHHVDYSQLFRAMQPMCIVDGRTMAVEDVLRDPALCGLLSDEGPLPSPRHPDL